MPSWWIAPDSRSYLDGAARILGAGEFADAWNYMLYRYAYPPGYSVIVALTVGVGASTIPWALLAVHAAASSAVAFAAAELTRYLRVGAPPLVGSIALALVLPHVAAVHYDVIAAALAGWALAALVGGRYWAAGLLLASLAMVAPSGTAMLFVLPVVAGVAAQRYREGLLAALLAIGLISPWVAHVYEAEGVVGVCTNTFAGSLHRLHCGIASRGVPSEQVRLESIYDYSEVNRDRPMRDVIAEHRDRTFTMLRHDIGAVPEYVGRTLAYTLFSHPRNWEAQWGAVGAKLIWQILYGASGALFLLGLWRMWLFDPRVALALTVLFAAALAAVLIAGAVVSPRHLLPATCARAIIYSLGVADWRFIHDKDTL